MDLLSYTSDEFEDLVRNLAPHRPEVQREALLVYFEGILSIMSADGVRELRAHFLRKFPDSEVQELMIELIDGHLATREILKALAESRESDAPLD